MKKENASKLWKIIQEASSYLASHIIHNIGLHHYHYFSTWYELISQRSAVVKGYDLFQKGNKIPPITS